MLSVNLGPLGLSVDRLLLAAAFLAALLVGWLVGRRRGVPRGAGIGAVLPDMLLAGLLAARVAFVLRWWESYRAQPWTVIDVRDVVFVFVNQGEAGEQVDRFLAQRGLSLDNVLLDPGGALARSVGSRAMPTTLFYDARGRLRDTHLGALSEATLAAGLARLKASR